ncbi:hypothetical protein M011DRAFT_312475 [Sporormia fimetaria CBS 119925]|uniref:Uncharacterized protein n=1 Tax=Sporormia fimetaria CBS 119925 TaxID=1340428 RepID=A0A6A6VG85_9PLEO|nr:hypothetical protein M011DRAFT_312475 [Sporormia fimetaria CBS 119925]
MDTGTKTSIGSSKTQHSPDNAGSVKKAKPNVAQNRMPNHMTPAAPGEETGQLLSGTLEPLEVGGITVESFLDSLQKDLLAHGKITEYDDLLSHKRYILQKGLSQWREHLGPIVEIATAHLKRCEELVGTARLLHRMAEIHLDLEHLRNSREAEKQACLRHLEYMKLGWKTPRARQCQPKVFLNSPIVLDSNFVNFQSYEILHVSSPTGHGQTRYLGFSVFALMQFESEEPFHILHLLAMGIAIFCVAVAKRQQK